MSSVNASLTDFLHAREDEQEEEKPVLFADYDGNVDGNTGLSKTCDHCGGQVTPDFFRVFSSNEGELHGCTQCMTAGAIQHGGPALGRDTIQEKGIEPLGRSGPTGGRQ